jgi:O-antigen ligase
MRLSLAPPVAARMEMLFLYAFIIALPVAEAPKSVFLALYAAQWIYNRFPSHQFGGPWKLWDSTLLALPIATFLSIAFSGLPGVSWTSGLDTVSYAVLGLLICRAGYGMRQVAGIYATLLISTLLALGYANWELYVTQARQHLEFHSVGFFLHTSIYLSIVTLAVLGALIYYRPLGVLRRLFLGVILLWFAWSVFQMESRLTAGLLVLGALLTGLAYPSPPPRFRILFVAGLALLITTSILVGNPALEKSISIHHSASETFLNGREHLWPGAITAWLRYPWFGIGVDNFSALTTEQVLQWVHAGYRLFDYSRYLHFSHAHSLYLNTLAERGLAGLLPLLLLLFLSGRLLWRHRPLHSPDPLSRTLWAGALGAWFITTLGGLFNTTLHHEHALLTLVLIGLFKGWTLQLGQGRDEDTVGEVS